MSSFRPSPSRSAAFKIPSTSAPKFPLPEASVGKKFVSAQRPSRSWNTMTDPSEPTAVRAWGERATGRERGESGRREGTI